MTRLDGVMTVLYSLSMSNTMTTWTTCQCCGGRMPAREIWEANRNDVGECGGCVDESGRCEAWSDDDLWSAADSAIEAAREALERDGYTVHDRSPGPGLYISNLAPDSAGASTEPGSEWDEECDDILDAISSIVDPLGCEAQWSDNDVVIDVR